MALSWDGTTLYFFSNRPGGFGGNDLWVSKRNKLTEESVNRTPSDTMRSSVSSDLPGAPVITLVKVVQVALDFDEALASTSRAAIPVRIRRRSPVEGLVDRLTRGQQAA